MDFGRRETSGRGTRFYTPASSVFVRVDCVVFCGGNFRKSAGVCGRVSVGCRRAVRRRVGRGVAGGLFRNARKPRGGSSENPLCGADSRGVRAGSVVFLFPRTAESARRPRAAAGARGGCDRRGFARGERLPLRNRNHYQRAVFCAERRRAQNVVYRLRREKRGDAQQKFCRFAKSFLRRRVLCGLPVRAEIARLRREHARG